MVQIREKYILIRILSKRRFSKMKRIGLNIVIEKILVSLRSNYMEI